MTTPDPPRAPEPLSPDREVVLRRLTLGSDRAEFRARSRPDGIELRLYMSAPAGLSLVWTRRFTDAGQVQQHVAIREAEMTSQGWRAIPDDDTAAAS
ncbi:MAG: hypothetical protein AB7O67_16395 [Vicinamibacterales bacterium]